MRLLELFEDNQFHGLTFDLSEEDGRVLLDVTQNGMPVAELIYEDGEVVWLHVEPFFRNQGLGSVMIQKLRDAGHRVPVADARTKDGDAFAAKLSARGGFDESVTAIDEVQSISTPGDDDNLSAWYGRDYARDEYIHDVGEGGYALYARGGLRSFGSHEFFVMDDSGETPIGYARATRGAKWVSVSMIYVHSDYRGQGIAMDFYKYWLDVVKTNVLSDNQQSQSSNDVWGYLARDYRIYAMKLDASHKDFEPIEEINSEETMHKYTMDDGSTRMMLTPATRVSPFEEYTFDSVTEARAPWLRVTPTMIDQAKGNKCQVLVEMPIEDFLDITTASDRHKDEISGEAHGIRDYNRWAKAGHDNDFRNRINTGKTQDDDDYAWGTIIMPFLAIRFDRLSNKAKVSGHEGRHRASAAAKAGQKTITVAICMKPNENMFHHISHGAEYHMTSNDLPDKLQSQFHSYQVSTSSWKIIDGDMQVGVRRRM